MDENIINTRSGFASRAILFFIAVVLVLMVSPKSFADTEKPVHLNAELMHNHDNDIELSPYIGNYLGDQMNNMLSFGGKAYYHFTNIIALGVNYSHTKISDDDPIFTSKGVNIYNLDFLLSNPASFWIGKVVHCDLFLSLGIGAIDINKNTEILGEVGGGIKVYFKPDWIALRIDVTSYIHPTPTSRGTKVNSDLAMTFGASFYIPMKKKAKIAEQ